MSKWIDADVLTSKLWFVEIKGECIDDIAEQIIRQCKRIVKDAPSIDIVRCKECVEYDGDDWCMYWENVINPDDFCSYGERKESE